MKKINNFPNYAITKDGEVWSCMRNGRKPGPGKKWYKLVPGEMKTGHQTVALYRDGIIYQKKVHRLVLETFVGPCPNGMESCHNDGNPRNNKLSNLRWGTPKENMDDRRKHKRYWGEAVWTSKLSPKDVIEIKKLNQSGISQCKLAKIFNVSQPNISSIIRGETWIHL